MFFIKITLVFVYVSLVWSFYFSNKLKNDMNFNAQINIEKKYPKWCYAMAIWATITFIMITISFIYALFWLWK